MSPYVHTGIRGLDQLLGGGWERGRITLIEGESGVGKTTLLILSSLSIARDGGIVHYIDAEMNFTPSLLESIKPPEAMKIVSPQSLEEQAEVVVKMSRLAPSYLSSLSLIVVDSLTYHYHAKIRSAEEEDERDRVQRELEKQLYALQSIARRHGVAVVASTWPTSMEEGGRVGGFAASAYSRTILRMVIQGEDTRLVKIVKHQNPALNGRSTILRLKQGLLEALPPTAGEAGAEGVAAPRVGGGGVGLG